MKPPPDFPVNSKFALDADLAAYALSIELQVIDHPIDPLLVPRWRFNYLYHVSVLCPSLECCGFDYPSQSGFPRVCRHWWVPSCFCLPFHIVLVSERHEKCWFVPRLTMRAVPSIVRTLTHLLIANPCLIGNQWPKRLSRFDLRCFSMWTVLAGDDMSNLLVLCS